MAVRYYPIKDEDSLNREIRRLKNRCKAIEDQFDSNIDQLKNNYALMAFNSVLGNRLRAFPVVGEFTAAALNNQKIQNLMQTLVDMLVDKTEGFIEKIAKKFSHNKDQGSES